MSPFIVARLVLLFAGIGLFIYSLRVGSDWARLAAIGVIAFAIVLRLVERFRNRQP